MKYTYTLILLVSALVCKNSLTMQTNNSTNIDNEKERPYYYYEMEKNTDINFFEYFFTSWNRNPNQDYYQAAIELFEENTHGEVALEFPLFDSIQYANPDAVHILLEKGNLDINHQDISTCTTPLTLALKKLSDPRYKTVENWPIYINLYNICHLLIDYEASPALKDYKERTPLMYAALSGEPKLINRLIENSSLQQAEQIINMKDCFQRTAISYAIEKACNAHIKEPYKKCIKTLFYSYNASLHNSDCYKQAQKCNEIKEYLNYLEINKDTLLIEQQEMLEQLNTPKRSLELNSKNDLSLPSPHKKQRIK